MAKTNIKLEICAASIESALAAEKGGADRIELCSALSEGGLSPSPGIIKYACENLSIPVFVLIRPRTGDFYYSNAEFETMLADIKASKEYGAKGVVCGMLNTDGTIDYLRMKMLVEVAKPMEVTFHRAFDMAKKPFVALEEVIKLGCTRILTSGQANSATQGAELLAQLVKEAGDRIIIMPGSGVRPENLGDLAKKTKAPEYHLSASATIPSRMTFKKEGVAMNKDPKQEYTITQTDPEIVAKTRQLANQIIF